MEPAGVRRPPGTWTTSTRDSPRRNLTDLCAIAEIVRRFDVCAIQETHGDLTALRTLLRRIGPDWGVLVTDAGEGDAANDERLACVFDRRFVSLSGLAGEMVIDECTFGDAATPLRRQFARGPFMTSFQAGPIDGRRAFTLVSLHVDYGRTAADRTPDLVTLAHRLKQRALEDDEFHHNFIALGDFTSIAGEDPNDQAFCSSTPPADCSSSRLDLRPLRRARVGGEAERAPVIALVGAAIDDALHVNACIRRRRSSRRRSGSSGRGCRPCRNLGRPGDPLAA